MKFLCCVYKFFSFFRLYFLYYRYCCCSLCAFVFPWLVFIHIFNQASQDVFVVCVFVGIPAPSPSPEPNIPTGLYHYKCSFMAWLLSLPHNENAIFLFSIWKACLYSAQFNGMASKLIFIPSDCIRSPLLSHVVAGLSAQRTPSAVRAHMHSILICRESLVVTPPHHIQTRTNIEIARIS